MPVTVALLRPAAAGRGECIRGAGEMPGKRAGRDAGDAGDGRGGKKKKKKKNEEPSSEDVLFDF